MPPTVPPPILRDGNFKDSESGLLVPLSYRNRVATDVIASLYGGGGIDGRGFNQGQKLSRDADTLAVMWPEKGSGYDDLAAQAIVDGTVANVGVSPVVAPQISGMVRRQQNQAATASIDLTGRATPVKAARDAIARFNDSPLGVTQALEKIVYGLCTYNRGAPIATVPITYAFDQWQAQGLNAVPVNASEEKASHFYLEVDWSKHGMPVPFLPSIYDLEPSGVAQWPYWYRVKRDGQSVWVLLHHTHILEITPGQTSRAGIGTSAVWMCLGYLAEQILITEERAEKMLYTMTDGLLLLGGVEGTAGQSIEDRIQRQREEHKNRGFAAAKPPVILSSPLADKVSAVTVSFRQPPGMEFKEWREYTEDIIAFCFGESLNALVTRGGVGYGAQSETAADNSAEAGVGAILSRVALALGAIYPRVSVSVSRPNDRSQRLNIKTLTEFANGAVALIDRGVFTPDDARNIIDRDILSLPQAGVGTAVASPNANEADDDQAQTDTAQERVEASARYGQLVLDTLYDEDDVLIEDADVERALDGAARIDADLYGLLTAEGVEG